MLWSKRKKAPKQEPDRESPLPEPVGNTLAPTAAPASPVPVIQRQLSYSIGNLQGVGRREHQEDSFGFVNAMDVTLIRNRGLLAILADGMGGMADGKLASETVVASLRQDFQMMDYSDDLGEQLRDMIRRANDRVYAQLQGDGGSTLVLCLFYQGQLWFGSVGDSALFLLRSGELLRLNREQNVLTDLYIDAVCQDSMDPNRARNDREKDALTQFLGMPALEEIDSLLRPMKLHDGDCFLLCSDGVSDIVPEPELQSCLEQPKPMQSCSALERAVINANYPYQDNFTALVIRCEY